jgi:hypothetical protein
VTKPIRRPRSARRCVLAVEPDPPFGHPPADQRQKPHRRHRRQRLARAAFADKAEDLPPVDGQADAVKQRHLADGDGHRLKFQKRAHAAARIRPRMSSSAISASP